MKGKGEQKTFSEAIEDGFRCCVTFEKFTGMRRNASEPIREDLLVIKAKVSGSREAGVEKARKSILLVQQCST